MSTKTTFKRIALVAVAALGFGVLTSVAPANATANKAVSSLTVGTLPAVRPGVVANLPVTAVFAASAATTDTITVTAKVISAPTGSVLFNAAANNLNNAGQLLNITVPATSTRFSNGTASFTAATNASGLTDAQVTENVVLSGTVGITSGAFNVALQADIAGTYQILVSANNATFTAGNPTAVITVTTAGVPTTITAASYGGVVTTSGRYGQLMYFTLADAAGNPTVLGANEGITLASNNTAITAVNGTGGATVGAAVTAFDSAYTTVGGRYYFRVVNTGTAIAANGTAVITLAGNGTLSPAMTVNASATLRLAAAATGTVAVAPATANVAAVRSNAAGTSAWSTGTMFTTGARSLSFTGTTNDSSAAAVALALEVKDSAGFFYNSTASRPLVATSATAATVAVTAPAVSATSGIDPTVTLLTDLASFAGTTATLSYGAPVARTISVLGSTSVLSATGGSTTWNIEVDNQYGVGIAFAPVTVTVTGRNTVLSTTIGVTDANGIISYTLKDAGTTGTRDSLSFGSGDLTAATATVTYGTVTVAKVSFTGPNTTSGVANATTVVSPIRANDTPEASTAAASVVVTDAAGNLLAGVPVVFTVSGTTGAAITSNAVTVYTTSAGVAASTVFAWVAGTYTVTATAGGITGTGSYTFANSTAADARVLSATVADGIISAKVVDRFGNPVSGVSVFASRTSGTGYFGTGVSKTTTTTDNDGIAEFTLIGTAEVLVSTLDYAAAPGTNAPHQTCALAGNLTCAVGATAATAFTATTAGTTAIAGANIGSSFAPAGVSRVTVSVNNNAAADSATAAADAAAEATDAANAATDAANAAAEAADAATAAAQDAADAVAALSTQVTELVSALRKQITSLTNLVIKIQRKVRA
jgi:trimeric autotransporter adhesin